MTLAIIVAMASNGVIGRNNSIPWHLPDDLRRFKRLTMGHDLVMGRRTFESIGRPLPGRRSIVITRQPEYRPDGVVVVASFDAAVEAARGDEVFVAGGAQIYEAALPRTSRMHVTEIEQPFEGDVYFPAFDRSRWRLIEEEVHAPDAGRPWGYRFCTYESRS